MATTVAERFWSKVERKGEDECWPWLAFRDRQGYGRFSIKGQDMSASRGAWIVINGTIPDDLQVLHTCDNPSCVNPAHLFLGTHADNMADKAKKKRVVNNPLRGDAHPNRQRTHCKNGHPYTEANTMLVVRGNRTYRGCRRCSVDNSSRWKKRNRKTTVPFGVHYQTVKTHCAQGHPYDEANTYWYLGKWRQCRACNNARRSGNHSE